MKQRINDRFWLEEEGSYADFYGTRAQAISTAEGAAKQIGLKGTDKLTARDKELIAEYQRLRSEFAAMRDTTRAWITNKNWVVATPMEMGLAPRARAIAVLDRLRKNDLGEYGPYLSAVEQQAMMTISTGVLAVAEAQYGRADQSLWYMNKIVGTFNRTTVASLSHGPCTGSWYRWSSMSLASSPTRSRRRWSSNHSCRQAGRTSALRIFRWEAI